MITVKEIEILNFLFNKEKMRKVDVAKKTNITYCHVCKVLKKFGDLKLVKFKPSGRVVFIELTVKGKKACDLANQLLVLVEW